MIVFTAGGALYQAFAAQYDCRKVSVREEGVQRLMASLQTDDVLIHNAASVAPPGLRVAVQDNFNLTRDIADALLASEKDVPLIFISSMSFLGEGGRYKDPMDMTPYAFAKYIAELYCRKSGVRTSCVRFSTLFYGDPSRDGLSKMIADAAATREISLINGGRDKRDFIPLAVAVQYLHKIAQTAKQNSGAGIASSASGSGTTGSASGTAGSTSGTTGSPFGTAGSTSGTAGSASGADHVAPRSHDLQPTYNIASGDPVAFAEAADMIKERIPGLKISNQDMPPSKQFVLSEFDKAHITALGLIPFDLRKYIQDYAVQLAGTLL